MIDRTKRWSRDRSRKLGRVRVNLLISYRVDERVSPPESANESRNHMNETFETSNIDRH